LISDNREELSTVLDILMSVYRDCVMLRQGMENRLINDDKKDIIKRIALSSSQRKLLDKISALEKMRRNFKYNLNFQLVLEVLFLEIQEV
jgi:DNA polymerase-3 subunit delta'